MCPSRDFCEEEQIQGVMFLPQCLFLAELYYPGLWKRPHGLDCNVFPCCQVTDKYGEED